MQVAITRTISIDLHAPQLDSPSSQAAAAMLLAAASKLYTSTLGSSANATLAPLHRVFRPHPRWAALAEELDLEQRLLGTLQQIRSTQVCIQ